MNRIIPPSLSRTRLSVALLFPAVFFFVLLALPGRAADWLTAPIAALRAAAEKGEAAAQEALGERLLRGRDAPANVGGAYRWTELAAQQEAVGAQLRLGTRHERGIGTMVDLDLAREWFQRAADKGGAGAFLAMARLRSSVVVGAEHDLAAAHDWLRKAAAGGELEALWQLAGALKQPALFKPELAAERRKLVEALASAGDSAAQAELGIHFMGRDFMRPTEPESALYWFGLARREDASQPLKNFAGWMAKALPPAKIAAVDRRVAEFQPTAGRLLTPGVQSAMFLDGPRPPRCATPESVARLAETRRLAGRGDAAAQFQLALNFHHSDGWDDAMHHNTAGLTVVAGRVARATPRPLPQHLGEAARWYRAAASNGIAAAGTHLGYLAANGHLSEADMAFAVAGVQRRAAAGDALAQHQLGNLQLTGRGVPRNETEAVRLLTRAAEAKVRDAMYQLGMIHHAGVVVPIDLGEAARWLRQAAVDGHPTAIRQMATLFGQQVAGQTGQAAKPAAPVSGTVAKPARLALVAVAEALRPMTDLLTVSLGALPEVVLLERAEIERVIREQSLAATLGRDPLKLGQLLGADGVLLLETNAVGDRVTAGARLVAVGPGVVLGEWLASFPVADAVGWSTRVAADAAPQLRKLSVPRDLATPISVLGLRMVVNGPDAASTQEGLSRLLTHRLTQEREIFVLERQRIERLGTEKILAGEGETPFWSGSHLLDGTLEPDLSMPGMLNVRLQVASPGATPVLLTASGPRTNLVALAETLAGKVLTALRKTSTARWQPETEAQRFWEAAAWDRRWGQWRAGAAAMESAWALGLRASNHATVRMELLLGSVQVGKLRWLGTAELPASLRQPPDHANLDFAARALESVQGHVGNRPEAGREQNRAWLAYAVAVLELTGRVLDEFYHAAEYRLEVEEQLAALRAQARATLELVQAVPALVEGAVSWEVLDPGFLESVLGGRRHTAVRLDELLALHARFWLESPDDVLALHRRLLQRPSYAAFRARFANQLPSPLIAWRTADRPGLTARWIAHLRTLAGSTNGTEQLEASLMDLGKVATTPFARAELGVAAAIRQFLDRAWQHREPLSAGGMGPHSFTSVLANCRSLFASYHQSSGGADPGKRLEAIVAGYENRFRDYQAPVALAAASLFLRDSKTEDAARFTDLVVMPNYTPEQVRELLPLARQYSKQFFHPPSLAGGLRQLEAIAAGETTRPANPGSTLPPAVASVPVPNPKAGTAPATSPVATESVALPPVGAPAADALRVTRFWLGPELRMPAESFVGLPSNAGHQVEQRHVEIHDWGWREERLWLAWRHTLSVRLPGQGWLTQECSHVAGYALPGLEGAAHPIGLPPEAALGKINRPEERVTPGKFEVLDGRVYVSGQDSVWRLDQQKWDKLPVELHGVSSLFAVHGRLVISAPDVLYSFDPKSGAVELLASARRRPAASAADAVVAGLVQVGLLPGGRMRLFAGGGSVMDYDFNLRKWAPLPARSGQAGVWQPDWVQVTSGGANDTDFLHLLPHKDTNWQFAAFQLPPHPRGVSALSSGLRLPGIPMWQPGDRTLSPIHQATTSHSNRLWSITGMNFQLGMTNVDTLIAATNGRHLLLAAWDQAFTQPAVLPLWLELPPGSLTRQPVARLRTYSSPTKTADARGTLSSTPPGLVYRNEAVPGFWFIPWSDVLPRVEAKFGQLAAAQAKRLPPGNNRNRQLLRTYDADGDGMLSPAELGVLFHGEKLDSDPNALRQFSMRFNQTDRDRNGALDENELGLIADLLKAGASSGVAPRPRGPGAPPGAPAPKPVNP